jgi:hypothetical protein
MKCIIHVYLLNDLFSQEFADLKHNGKESADNRKYLWEDEFQVVGDVDSIEELNDAIYPLKGQFDDGTMFDHQISDMKLIAVSTKENPVLFVGASESIVERLEILKGREWKVKIYLKDNEPYANPVPGIYIASKAFPEELIR